MPYDELLDLVDANDVVIGQKFRSEIYSEGLKTFRVVNAFLMNTKKELWIPRRTKTKKLFPLCLDASMGGHVEAGETYEQALTRELMEELRIDITKSSYEYIGMLNPYQHGTSAFMKVYILHVNEAPLFNTNDFCEYFWLNPSDLLARIASGEQCKSDLPIIISKFFDAD